LLLVCFFPLFPRNQCQAIERATQEMAAERSLGVFFWILDIGLGIAIIIHYLGQVPGVASSFL